MKLLLDMNLSPRWVQYLHGSGHVAQHWSAVGAADAADAVLMQHARDSAAVVLTHDLDFGALLALTGEAGPSVIQIRVPSPSPELVGPLVLQCLADHEAELSRGALLVLDAKKKKLRLLPLNPDIPKETP